MIKLLRQWRIIMGLNETVHGFEQLHLIEDWGEQNVKKNGNREF